MNSPLRHAHTTGIREGENVLAAILILPRASVYRRRKFLGFSQMFGNVIIKLKFIDCVFRTYFNLIFYCNIYCDLRYFCERVYEILAKSDFATALATWRGVVLPEHYCTTESFGFFFFFWLVLF